MLKTSFRILLIETESKNNLSLTRIFDQTSHELILPDCIESVVQNIESKNVDIIIFKNMFSGESGFTVFKKLRPFLLKSGVPFVLYLDIFEKEEVLTGLEMGIDNFIIPPFDFDSVIFMLENEIMKKIKLDVFDTTNFVTFFNSSFVPMFFMSGNRILKTNPAYCYYLSNEFSNQNFCSIFNLEQNINNEIRFRKFRSGLIESCKLTQVECKLNPDLIFDINLYHGNKMEISSVLGELLPSGLVMNKDEDNETPHLVKKSKKHFSYINATNINSNKIKLTDREVEIFELSAKGLPIKMIAAQLNLSDRTVEKHRANIMLKANSKNIIEAIARIKNNRKINHYHQVSF